MKSTLGALIATERCGLRFPVLVTIKRANSTMWFGPRPNHDLLKKIRFFEVELTYIKIHTF